MQIELSEQARAIVDSQVASGAFASPAAVVEQAIGFFAIHGGGEVCCVDPSSGERLTQAELGQLIQEGLDEEAAGLSRPLDIEDILQRGRERVAARASVK